MAAGQVVLATKVGNPMGDDPQQSGLSRRWITQACDDSLRRLQVDHIDLYQITDPTRPRPSTRRSPRSASSSRPGRWARSGRRRSRRHRSTRSANVPARARRGTADERATAVLLGARGDRREVLPACRRRGLGVIVWAPLNGGWLTGKYQGVVDDAASRALRQPDHFDHGNEVIRAEKHALVDQLGQVAIEAGLTLKQLALAFVLDDPTITAAIIGPRLRSTNSTT